MPDVEVWTIKGSRAERADDGASCEVFDGNVLVSYECRERELWRYIPIDVVADLLRAAGYRVVSPKAQQELGR